MFYDAKTNVHSLIYQNIDNLRWSLVTKILNGLRQYD